MSSVDKRIRLWVCRLTSSEISNPETVNERISEREPAVKSPSTGSSPQQPVDDRRAFSDDQAHPAAMSTQNTCSTEPVQLRDCFVDLLTTLAGRETNMTLEDYN